MAKASGSSMSVDTSGFKKLASALRRTDAQAASDLRKGLKSAADTIVVPEAKARAAAFSKSIPPTIKSRTSGVTVTIQAGGNGPLAMLEENQGNPGSWRHPVFGSDTWVSQTAHPYLHPAVEAKAVEMGDAVAAVIDVGIASLLDGEFGP